VLTERTGCGDEKSIPGRSSQAVGDPQQRHAKVVALDALLTGASDSRRIFPILAIRGRDRNGQPEIGRASWIFAG
jgi:hypothetical protein